MNRRSLARALRSFAPPLCLLLGGVGVLALPVAANASEGIYWTNGENVEAGTVGGTNETPATILYEKLTGSTAGLALDPVGGKLYWSEPASGYAFDGAIGGEKTAGTQLGSTTYVSADGVSFDEATSKLYWSDPDLGEIIQSSPTGSETSELLKESNGIAGIAVDQSEGKIYWANFDTNQIDVASLAGGTASIEPLYSGLDTPEAVAIDPTTEDIYWTEAGSEEVVAAPLVGAANAGTITVLYKEQEDVSAIAVDPSTGDLYWGAEGHVMAGNVTGSAETELYPTDVASAGLALLDSPVAVSGGAPVVSASGTPAIGSTLTCSTGTWATDLPESQLYRSPTSYAYQWLREKAAVKGATSATLKVIEGGSYTCQVTAANAAGSTPSATSAAVSVPAPAPTVSISTPASGATYTQHETVATKFSCKEGAGGPGIESCNDSNGVSSTGSGAGSLNTATPGSYTYTVTAVSKDKETATASISYTVAPYAALEAFPEVTIASLAKSEKAGKIAVKLACEPGVACSGKLALTAKVKAKAGKKGKAKSQTLTLASGSYSLAAGKSKTVELKLQSKALKVLEQAKKTKLTVKLKATVKGGLAATVSQKLALTATKAKKAKSGKKGSGKASKPGKKTAAKS